MTKAILGMLAFFAIVALMAWAFGLTGGPK